MVVRMRTRRVFRKARLGPARGSGGPYAWVERRGNRRAEVLAVIRVVHVDRLHLMIISVDLGGIPAR
ncbi:hypothetical protein EKH55_1845 [Sinorhizobium alkalisoli]|nr:hypothetical protein EKH55_1845 [Sinorhizobium alkalisoli]